MASTPFSQLAHNPSVTRSEVRGSQQGLNIILGQSCIQTAEISDEEVACVTTGSVRITIAYSACHK